MFNRKITALSDKVDRLRERMAYVYRECQIVNQARRDTAAATDKALAKQAADIAALRNRLACAEARIERLSHTRKPR